MFIKLLNKEIKYLLGSISSYLLLVVIIAFYFSQFEPPGINDSIKPVSEMEFIYNTMAKDYENGSLSSNIITGAGKELSSEDKKAVKKAMDNMKGDKEVVGLIREKYLDILGKLDKELGGDTYYGDRLREEFLRISLNYGQKPMDDSQDRMRIMLKWMSLDYRKGEIYSYRFGMARTIRFGENEKQAIRDAMNKMKAGGTNILDFPPKDFQDTRFNIDESEFADILDTLDKKLGGMTRYNSMMRDGLMTTSMTYEEAMVRFNTIVEKDMITNAYARIFADYMGITAGFFPVFLAAFILIKDRRRKMHELINSRKVSSTVYIAAKYMSIVIFVTVIYLLLSTHATLLFHNFAKANGYRIDYFAFYKYCLIWVLPTLLFTVALGMCISIIIKSGVPAIPVQFFIWFISMMPLSGDYRIFKPVIRFNQVSSHDVYLQWSLAINTNRMFFLFVSVLLFMLTVFIWSKRRSGSSFFGKGIFYNFKI